MDINTVWLNSMQCAEYMRNKKCFICHQVGCNICNHKKDVQKPHARK